MARPPRSRRSSVLASLLPARGPLARCAVVLGAVVLGAAVLGALGPALPAMASPPSAASTYVNDPLVVNSFAFTGALSGSLHVLPKQDCNGAGPAGVTLTVSGQLQGSRSSAFVIQVLSLNNGTYTLRPGSVIGITVSAASGAQQWGLNPRGTLTVDGTTGTVDASLSGTDNSWLHVIGAWSCPVG